MIEIAIVGAGAGGLTAALAAHDAGAEVVVLERDPLPRGSTALSSGMIPACGTRLQKAKPVADSPAIMAADIQRKAKGEVDPQVLDAVCRASGPTVDWLIDEHGIDLQLVEGFLYPGHSRLRMHAPPSKTGIALMDNLIGAAERAAVTIVSNARATDLAVADGRVTGLTLRRPDRSTERLDCAALILACNGYGGNPELVRRYIPEIADALYFGHSGNQGDALRWGEQLGAALRHLGAYQGHGSVATPHGILITWALMMEGGIQVNASGVRFANEHRGYSEQAVAVLAQPKGLAWNIFDRRLHDLGMGFEDYRNAWRLGAIKTAATVKRLAAGLGLPETPLAATLAATGDYAKGASRDPHGRDFTTKPALRAPFYGVKVTGALFHTQGGLLIDAQARVLRPDGQPLTNVFAVGGAACGLSGSSVEGYLSGNGLLSAVVLGRIAGQSAAEQVNRIRRVP